MKHNLNLESPCRSLRVLVVGAGGGTGREVVHQLHRAGHVVTALSRRTGQFDLSAGRFAEVQGDVMRPQDLDRATAGQDAVVVTLGINEDPLKVRLFGTSHTPLNVRSRGTRNIIEAMERQGVHRLVVQSSFGVGETRGRLRWVERLFFSLLLKPQIEDTERQESEVRGSHTDWTLVQPVHLTDAEDDSMPLASGDGKVGQWRVSRRSVARFMACAVDRPEWVHRSFALSQRGQGSALRFGPTYSRVFLSSMRWFCSPP